MMYTHTISFFPFVQPTTSHAPHTHTYTHTYIQVMYLALDNVHPITLAVGNTAKRVFIIVASLVRFWGVRVERLVLLFGHIGLG